MRMMARSIATAVTPTPARIILSVFGRDRDHCSYAAVEGDDDQGHQKNRHQVDQ
jgi:hypothetical protein